MTTEEILRYVDTAPGTTKEVFSSVSGTRSNATRKAAKQAIERLVEDLNDSVATSSLSYLRRLSVEDFMAFAEAHNVEQQQTWRYRFFVEPFKSLWLRVLAFLFDLSYDALSKLSDQSDDRYFQVGDAIVLAGVYLLLKDGESDDQGDAP